MTKQTEALKMAHKSFMQLNERHPRKDNGNGYFDEEIQACKEALEQPSWQGNKEFVELSNDRIREIGDNCLENNNGLFNWIDFGRAIEQELKTKNGFSALKEKNNV